MVIFFSEDFPIWPFIIYTMAYQFKYFLMRGQVNLDHESDVVHLNFGKHKKTPPNKTQQHNKPNQTKTLWEKLKSKKNREKWSFYSTENFERF